MSNSFIITLTIKYLSIMIYKYYSNQIKILEILIFFIKQAYNNYFFIFIFYEFNNLLSIF